MANGLVPDDTFYLNSVRVNEYLLKDHNINDIPLPNEDLTEIIGITIHNTDDLPEVEDSAEQYTAATIDGDMKDVRVHYYVDDLGAWQNLPLNSTGWHAADGDGDGNTKTIAIETIMSSEDDPNSLKARDNAAKLAAYLLYENGLDENDLYTHSYWLNVRDGIEGDRDYLNTLPNPYKTCPIYIIPNWYEFKEQVAGYIDELKSGEATARFDPYPVEVSVGTLNVRGGPGMDFPVTARINYGEKYMITDRKSSGGISWGKLDSGAGWVDLQYTQKV